MAELNRHWTERDVDSFMYRIGADFVRQLQHKMESANEPISQAELAARLGVSEGRVSQVLNNPGNIGLRKIVHYSRVLGLKVSVVAYDDGDPDNKNGPVNSEIFSACWKGSGRPRDFFALHASQAVQMQVSVLMHGTYNYAVAGTVIGGVVVRGGVTNINGRLFISSAGLDWNTPSTSGDYSGALNATPINLALAATTGSH